MRIPGYATAAAVLFAAASAFAGEHVVSIDARAYQAEHVTMLVGETIRFVNDDTEGHAVFVPNAGHALNLGNVDPGEESVFVPQKPGAFDVECVYHGGMHMTVEVK